MTESDAELPSVEVTLSVPPLLETESTPLATEAVQSVSNWLLKEPRPRFAEPLAPPRSPATAGVSFATDCDPAREESEVRAEFGIVNVSSDRSVKALVASRRPQTSCVIVTAPFAKANEVAFTVATLPANVLKPIPYPFPSVKATFWMAIGPGAVKPVISVIFGAVPTSGRVNVNPPP